MTKVNIGQRIAECLEESNISKTKLAEELKMSHSQLSQMLSKPSIDTGRLVQICKILNHNFFAELSIIEAGNMNSESLEKGFTLYSPNIGKNIKKKLEEKKVTQAQLSTHMGVTQQEVSRMLKRETISTDKLEVISVFLSDDFFMDYYSWNDVLEYERENADYIEIISFAQGLHDVNSEWEDLLINYAETYLNTDEYRNRKNGTPARMSDIILYLSGKLDEMRNENTELRRKIHSMSKLSAHKKSED